MVADYRSSELTRSIAWNSDVHFITNLVVNDVSRLSNLTHYLCLMIAAAILRIDFWCSYPRLGRSEKYAKRTFAASTASFWRISMSWTSSAIWMSSFIICCGTSSCKIKICSNLPKSDVGSIIWCNNHYLLSLLFCLFAIVKSAQNSDSKNGWKWFAKVWLCVCCFSVFTCNWLLQVQDISHCPFFRKFHSKQ